MTKLQIETYVLVLILCSCVLVPLASPIQEQTHSSVGPNPPMQKGTNESRKLDSNMGISLNDGKTCTLPEFPENASQNSIAQVSTAGGFVLAATNYNKPNITSVYWQNITSGNNNWVTWMEPGGTVEIWFEVKGPIDQFGDNVTVSFDTIIDGGASYGVNLGYSNLNFLGDVGINQTQWYSWTWSIPDEGTLDYGYGTGFVNAFALRLYGPLGESYYEGLNGTSSQLYMYGSFKVSSLQWYNLTSTSNTVPIDVAQPGWYVSPYYLVSIENAPVWNVDVVTEWRADVVWWPDTHIAWSATYHVSDKLYPGYHYVYPRSPSDQSKWVFYQIDPSKTYGTGIGNIRGIYCKFFLNGTEIYSSNEENKLLYVVDHINQVAPNIDVIRPMNGEVFTGPTINIDAFVSDANSNYQISTLIAYVDGTPVDVIGNYDRVVGRLNTTISLPQDNGVVNITLYAVDTTGLSDNVTILVRSDDPTSYFPSTYVSGHEHYALTFLKQEFVWESSMSYVSGDAYNLTFTPKVTLTVTPAVEFDLYNATPASVSAGDSYATYLKLSDPQLTLTIQLRFELGYQFSIGLGQYQGSVVLFDKTWQAAKDLELGVDVLDLRYDLPGVSEYIQPYTHYEVELLKAVPVVSSLAELNLIVDIVPLLRISTLLDAAVTGINTAPNLSKISFASDSLYAIQSTVSGSASGGSCGIRLDNFDLSCAAGLDLSVQLKLAGSLLGLTLKEVDLNQWVYDTFGITIPSLDIWLGRVSIPLTGTVLVETSVVPQQLNSEMTGLSANEHWINVTVSLGDQRSNSIAGATMTASVHGSSCTVAEVGSGTYVVSIPYTPDKFTLDIEYSKAGYSGGTDSFDIYIDPLLVDSTAPSISGITQSDTSPVSGENIIIDVSLTDTLTGIANATLFFSINNGNSWTAVNMLNTTGSSYEGTIPSQKPGVTVLYYIAAEDGAGNQAESICMSYTVGGEQTTTSTTATNTETSTTSNTVPTGSSTPTGIAPPDMTLAIVIGVGVAAIIAVSVIVAMAKRRN